MNTVKTFSRALLVALAALTLAACGSLFGDEGYFRDKSEDYKIAPETTRTTVPEGKDDRALKDIYYVPPVKNSLVLEGEFEVPRPTPLVAGASDEIVRIQKLGGQSWALISMAPGQLWPQIRAFLTAASIPVARMEPRAGIIETGWLNLEEQTIGSRFQFRIEQGVQRGDSELHVLQMNQAGDVSGWPEKSDNPALEQEILQGISQFVANSAESSPVSMIADQSINASGKISLQESEAGTTFIELGLPFHRAWASVAKALETSTFEITDRDRSKGEYYVLFHGPEEVDDGGWFDWFSGDDEHPLAGREFLVKVEEQNASSVGIYLFPQGEGEAVERRQEQALLMLIKGNIN